MEKQWCINSQNTSEEDKKGGVSTLPHISALYTLYSLRDGISVAEIYKRISGIEYKAQNLTFFSLICGNMRDSIITS